MPRGQERKTPTTLCYSTLASKCFISSGTQDSWLILVTGATVSAGTGATTPLHSTGFGGAFKAKGGDQTLQLLAITFGAYNLCTVAH